MNEEGRTAFASPSRVLLGTAVCLQIRFSRKTLARKLILEGTCHRLRSFTRQDQQRLRVIKPDVNIEVGHYPLFVVLLLSSAEAENRCSLPVLLPVGFMPWHGRLNKLIRRTGSFVPAGSFLKERSNNPRWILDGVKALSKEVSRNRTEQSRKGDIRIADLAQNVLPEAHP